jgi:glycosyltransferase involved in cell wall biosynthesis
MKITHLTSAHSRYDTRIFIKECISLTKNINYQINLVVADGKGNERKNNVDIFDIGKKIGGRISRMTSTVKKVYKKALELDSDIYHLHDPELIPIGLKLKKMGKKVIFDAHEDLPKQIIGKPYLNKFLLIILSKIISKYENYTCKKFDYIVTATPFIKEKFLKINENSIDINNFPILGELSNETPWSEKKNEVCYVGGIAKIRGIREIVRAMKYTHRIKLNLAGSFNEKEIEKEVKEYVSWNKVNELGFINRVEIADVLKKSKVGLVTLYPIINYCDALPVKMFEYMASGIPVISSDIPLWKNIIETNECGICVDPMNPKEIGKAIQYLIDNPKESEKMGKNGKKSVIEKYNWTIEEEKLLNIYKELLDENSNYIRG